MLATLTALKVALGIAASNTTRDEVLNQSLTSADRAIKSYTKRPLESTTYTWYLSGSGRHTLVLPVRPVSSITSLYLDNAGFYGQADGAFAASTLLTEGTDYVLKYDDPEQMASQSGIVLRLAGGANPSAWNIWPAEQPQSTLSARLAPFWPKGYGNIKVVAVAGYTTIPEDLSQACLQLAVWLWQNTPQGGVPYGAESYEEYSYSLAFNAIMNASGVPELGTTRSLLAPYKELVL